MPMIDIAAIDSLIREVAAEHALPYWRNLGTADVIEKRGPDDLVTIADRAVETALTRRLSELLPGSTVVGEEAVHANPALLHRLREDGRIWVIDPIDGTSNFASGNAGFVVMVALVDAGSPVAGWLYAPALGESTFAARGEGVWRRAGGAPSLMPPLQPVREVAQLTGMVGKRSFSEAQRSAVLARRSHFQDLVPNTGCAGLDYPLLAAGERHFALYSKSEPWDHLPGLAILSERGFHYARHDGSPYRPGDNTGGLLIAPNAELWRSLRNLLLG